MLITGYSGSKLHVAACLDGEMVDIGYVSIRDLEGFTLTLFEEWHEVCQESKE